MYNDKILKLYIFLLNPNICMLKFCDIKKIIIELISQICIHTYIFVLSSRNIQQIVNRFNYINVT